MTKTGFKEAGFKVSRFHRFQGKSKDRSGIDSGREAWDGAGDFSGRD
jgi:hypothetical protein